MIRSLLFLVSPMLLYFMHTGTCILRLGRVLMRLHLPRIMERLFRVDKMYCKNRSIFHEIDLSPFLFLHQDKRSAYGEKN